LDELLSLAGIGAKEGKYKSKSKGKRNIGASIKVNCKCYVSTLENPLTKEVVIAQAAY